MACNLTSGRNEVCKDSIGGIQSVYFINFPSGTTITKDVDGQVSAITSGTTAYKFELKGNSAYVETTTSSRDNGTTIFDQVLTLNLKKLDNATTTQLKLLAYGRPQIIVHTNNGEAFIVGEKRGAELTSGTAQTGAALGDLFGYSMTFQGTEALPASFLKSATVTDPFAGLSTKPTIVSGTN